MDSVAEGFELQAAALDVAFKYIALHGLIKERHTLLVTRLVLRAWRRNDSFNSRITAITLRTPEDLLLLPRFLPLPDRHNTGVWRDTNDEVAFKSVKKLIVDRSLCMPDIPAPAGWRREDVFRQFEVAPNFDNWQDFQLCESSLFSEIRPVWTSAESISSLTIGIDKHRFKRMGSDGPIFTLLSEDTVGPAIACLEGLQSLRHLESHVIITDLNQIGALRSFGALTQLTRLDLELEIDKFSHVTLREIERLLQQKTLPFLWKYEIRNLSSSILPRAEFKENVFQNCTFHLQVCVDEMEVSANSLNAQVRQLIQDYEAERHIETAEEIWFSIDFPSNCLRRVEIDLSLFKGAKSVSVDLTRPDTIMCQWPGWNVFGPTFINSSNTTLAIKEFSLFAGLVGRDVNDRRDGSDISAVLRTLPTLMPDIEEFRTDVIVACPECLSELRLLTRLNHLSISFSEPSGTTVDEPILDLSLLPTSIGYLRIKGCSFEPTPTLSLPRLAKLCCYVTFGSKVISRNATDERLSMSLDPFLHCAAPLTELIFWGHAQADVVAATFPRLEKLLFVMEESNVTALGNLPVLRELELVQRPQVHEPIGLSSLTQLSVLKMQILHEAYPTDCISHWVEVAMQLTQLRKLRVRMFLTVPVGMRYDCEAAEQIRRAHEEYLRMQMPHTRIKIVVR